MPSWLRRNSQRVLPAPFSQTESEPDPESDDLDEDGEPEPFPTRGGQRESLPLQRSAPPPQQRASMQPPQRASMQPPGQQRQSIVPQPLEPLVPPPGRDPLAPPRRSSLPPRHTAPPPAVVITRPPPVPNAELPPPPQAEPPRPITPEEQEAFALAALELASLRARLLLNVETEVLELAVAIASAIIEREVKLDPGIYAQLARSAVAVLGDTNHAKLRVSRAAHRAISEIHGEAAVDVDGVRVELTLDNSLEGLSVVAESGASRVDGRVSERLAAVMRAMEAEHRQAGDGE